MNAGFAAQEDGWLWERLNALREQVLSLAVCRFSQRTLGGPKTVPRQAVFSVPFPRDKRFVGRQSVLGEMEGRLRTEHCVSLLGMDCVGYGVHASDQPRYTLTCGL